MKTKLIILLLYLPFMAISQFTSSLDVTIGSEFSYRYLSTSDNDLQFIVDSRSAESQKHNWRFGINYNRQLSPKFYLKTGVRFANVGYQRKITGLIYSDQYNGDIFDPTIESIDPSEIKFTYNHLFIEVPLIARYQFHDKKWSPFVEFGVSPMILLGQKTKYRFDDETNSSSNSMVDYNPFHLAGNFSVGMNYNASEQLQFFAQPIFRYHFTNSVNDVPINENLFNYGIEFGVRRKI